MGARGEWTQGGGGGHRVGVWGGGGAGGAEREGEGYI